MEIKHKRESFLRKWFCNSDLPCAYNLFLNLFGKQPYLVIFIFKLSTQVYKEKYFTLRQKIFSEKKLYLSKKEITTFQSNMQIT